ncbi:MAG: purine-nucleoside phosphorylase [Sandaracinaceae bacterium]|nr:purine-nucleoside phosphorylase [Sandaracinaceae bacterium]MDW8246756.1 purine-nucleoside phosphorylase [Sandaracinaceae bacterium]
MGNELAGPWERLEKALQAMKERIPFAPRLGIVLGSGLGDFAEGLESKVFIPYADVPSMPEPKVPGHAGRFVFGRLRNFPCAVMQGRVHLYEGHSPEDVVLGVRLLARLGASVVILTNAAGSTHRKLRPGDLMLIEDQINLTGRNPLVGPNDERLGPRFPDMSEIYDASLRELALCVSLRLGIPLFRGVYAGLLGPSYETPAEIKMLERIGADAVGMSTVLEAIALRHMGTRVLGISCITNLGAGLGTVPLDHREVEEVAKKSKSNFSRLLGAIVEEIAGQSV